MAIDSPEALRQHLQWALELEHSTIPPYLCALTLCRSGQSEAKPLCDGTHRVIDFRE